MEFGPVEDPRYLGFRWWRVYRDKQGVVQYGGWFYWQDWNKKGWTEAHHGSGTAKMAHPDDLICPAFIRNSRGAHFGNHGCGLHAWRTLAQAHGAYEQPVTYSNGVMSEEAKVQNPIGVMGIVKVHGRIVFHGGEGCRAQYARPMAFAVPDNTQIHPMLAELNEELGLPVFSVPEWGKEVPTTLERFADEFGVRLPIRMGEDDGKSEVDTAA